MLKLISVVVQLRSCSSRAFSCTAQRDIEVQKTVDIIYYYK